MRIYPAAASLKQKFSAALFLCVMFCALSAGQAYAQTPPPTTLTFPGGWTPCANEGAGCWFPGTVRDVAYGNAGNYVFILSRQDNAMCNTAMFFNIDPLPGKAKYCWYSNSPTRLASASVCAIENGTCAVTGIQTVWYGRDGRYASKQYGLSDTTDTARSVPCNNTEFGDPNPGHLKFCLVSAR